MNSPIRGVEFSSRAISEYLWWQKNQPGTAAKIERFIASACENPMEGIGKPEALKYQLSGYYSRRITVQDRMIYTVTADGILFIFSLRFHY